MLKPYLIIPETRMKKIEDFNLTRGFLSSDDMNTFKQMSQRIHKLKSEHIHIFIYNQDLFTKVYDKLKQVHRYRSVGFKNADQT